MNTADRTRERLVGVALAGAVALNFPVLYLFSGPGLYLYLFVAWAALIALLALISRDGGRPRA